jgi:hypothetical protein
MEGRAHERRGIESTKVYHAPQVHGSVIESMK